MRGLSGSVDDHIGADFFDQIQNPGSIANVEFVVGKASQRVGEPALVPTGVSLWPEKDGSLVIIHSMNGIIEFIGKIDADLRADQARGSSDENGF